MKKKEEVEILEEAVSAVSQKYGYQELTVAWTQHPDYKPWSVAIAYHDGTGAAGAGRTLRDAISAASVEALNNKAKV